MDGNKIGLLTGGKRDALPYVQLMQLLLVSANPVMFGCKRERKKIANIGPFTTIEIIITFVTITILDTICVIGIFETCDTIGIINLVEMVSY